ncbi:MAG: putative rane-bound dehydrogenase, partial [Verrucomicrobiales bacterium]|nr:putative rane-bound dehydrogenase [Verrucomicrobiales bacterium]
CVIPHFWHMIQGGKYERQGGPHYSINALEMEEHRGFTGTGPNYVNPFVYDDIKTIADHVHYAGNKGPHAGNGRSDAAGGGHAHAGLMVYQGASWPEQYNGKAFMNNIHGARLNMDIMERSGSGFVGHHGADFVNFNDTWSQVLNMLYDQDGSVYIIDWYDKNQCHHNDVNGHDRTNGRIFKLVYNNQKHTPIDLQKLSNNELADLQLAKNDFYVRHARRILQERGKQDDARSKLLSIINTNPEASRILRAAWALHSMGALDEATSLQLLKSPHEYVRGWAIQLAMEDQAPSAEFKNAILQLASKDTSPTVRLYAWSAVQRMPLAERWELVTALLEHKEDATDHNIPLMAWYGIEPMVSKNPAKALALSIQTGIPRLLNYTVRRLAANSRPGSLDLITESLSTQTDQQKVREMISGLAVALKGQKDVTIPKGWNSVEEKWSTNPDAEIGAQVQSLSLTFGSNRALESLRKTALDNKADLAGRRTALDALLNAGNASTAPVLRSLLSNTDLRGNAIRGLAHFDDPEAAPAILAIYKQLNPSEKKDALTTLASRVSNAKPLIQALEKNTVSRSDLSADLIRQLKSLKSDEINSGIEKVWGSFREATADKKAQIAKLKAIYAAGGSTPGDASRGREVFSRTCQQCHTLFDTGGKVGPDLTGSNRADLDYILLNIVDPNAVIPNEYRSSTIDMKDDRVITGIVKQQDDKTLTVVTPNEVMTLPRSEIKTVQQSELSMMPEGLIDVLSEREIRDLIYYLSRPGQVNMPAAK